MGKDRVKECSCIDQLATGIILELIDYHIDVICCYKINKRILLKKEIFNVAVESLLVMSNFTAKHCLIM